MFLRKENQKINKLIRDLYFNRKIAEYFQKDPEAVGRKYGVLNEIIEAIKKGDTEKLIEAGMNPKFLEDPSFRLRDKLKLAFSRFAFILLLIVGVAGCSLPAMARTRKRRKEVGLLRAVNRVLRNFNFKVEIEGVTRQLYRNARHLRRRKEIILRRLRRKNASLNAREIASRLLRMRAARVRKIKRMIDNPSLLNRRVFDHIGNSSIIFLDPIE